MDFENITNKQLREKCLKYGLPNVPVTDTNRKLLIKRLNNAMDGTPSGKSNASKASASSNRRRTVHATMPTTTVSYNDKDGSVNKIQRINHKDALRRQTIAPVAQASLPRPRPIASKHNVEGIMPMKSNSVVNSTRISDVNGDSGINDGKIERMRRSVSLIKSGPATTTHNDHRRRSVSLTKTGVATASYRTENKKEPLLTTYEHDVEEDDYEEEKNDKDNIEYAQTLYSGFKQAAKYFNNNLVATNFTMPAQKEAQPTAKKPYPDLDSIGALVTNLGITHKSAANYILSSPPLNIRNSGINCHTITAAGDKNGNSLMILGHKVPIYQSVLKLNGRKRTVKGFTKRSIVRAVDNDDLPASSSDGECESPSLHTFFEELDSAKPKANYMQTSTIDDDGLAEGSSDGECKSPYLSKFLRELDSPKHTSTASAHTSIIKRRRSTYYKKEANTGNKQRVTLEQKYRLKSAFYVLLILAIIIFVPVFLFAMN